jgi:hypothetical protein
MSYSKKFAATTSIISWISRLQSRNRGKGVVVPGCPACRERIDTMSKFLHHLAEDAMPALIEKLSADAKAE